jgi:hypothetical protein
MAALYVNNLSGVISGAISDVATQLTLTTGTGVNFPSPTGGDYFLLTLAGLDIDGKEISWEVIKVTTRSTDVLAIERGFESTTAVSWISGSRVEMRMTAGQAGQFEAKYTQAEVDAALALKADAAATTTSLDGKVDDAQVLTDVPAGALFTDTDTVYSHPATHAWSEIDTTPTTLAGYGITDGGGGTFTVDDIENAPMLVGSLSGSDEFLMSNAGTMQKASFADVLWYVEQLGSFLDSDGGWLTGGSLHALDFAGYYMGSSDDAVLYSDGADVLLDLGGSHDFVIRDGTSERFRFRDGGELNVVTGSVDLDVGEYQLAGTALTTGFTYFRALTQATYDGLTPDANTIYFING